MARPLLMGVSLALRPKPCGHCEIEYTGDSRSVYCSRICRGRAKEARATATPESRAARQAGKNRATLKWYYANRSREMLKIREKYWSDPEKARAKSLETYYKNPQRTIERNAVWRANNPERVSAQRKRWVEENPEYLRNYHADYYVRNKEKFLEANRRYAARKKSTGVVGNITQNSLAGKLAYWGNCCWMCGGEFEHWDHVKPLSKNGPHLLSNLRPSCAKCNLSKSGKWDGVGWAQSLRII